MRYTTGILLGAMLMLGVFLLALSTWNASPPVKALFSDRAEWPPANTREAKNLPGENSMNNALPSAAGTASQDEPPRPDHRSERLALNPQSWNQSMGAYESVLHKDATEVSRYRVWSPFHSEWAAQGFARRLTLATDVPVEVVNEGPGNYQVVFSYRDDGQRQAMVRQIEAVTGLELE